MMGEGVAKKEMARRTGLSVPTIRKYLKMIEQG
jgi:DNA-binding CsgD family transcriptional regulator